MNPSFAMSAPARAPRLFARALAQEILCEWRNLVRMPAFSVPTLLFPLAFYLMFAVVLPFTPTPEARTLLLVNFTIFGVMGPGLFAFGVGLANDRDQGWLRLKLAAPLPPALMMLARMVVAMGFALIVVVLLFAAAATLGGVRLSRMAWLGLAATGVLSVLPASALGMALGAWLGARSSVAVVNIVYLGMAMLSGLWFPLALMPAAVQALAPWLPPYHMAGLARDAAGLAAGSASGSVLWLAAFTLIAFAVAAPGFRRPGARS
jgi:ABC-2 type transport system permease protein